jgi:tRNA pseudouridine38-40 synthase
VQGALEAAFARVTGQEEVRVIGSGRTDAGVHAEGQVASVRLPVGSDPDRLRRSLNGVLPLGVAVRVLERAPEGFDARRDATSKRYRYALWNGPVRSPLRRARTLHVERRLDLTALRRAAGDLVGHHDFASFQAAGSSVATTERTLFSLGVQGEAGGAVDLLFEGSGFLRHMVRNLTGTLLEVGAGRRDPTGMPGLLAARDRRQAGPTAPAHALTLVAVRYDSAAVSAGSA